MTLANLVFRSADRVLAPFGVLDRKLDPLPLIRKAAKHAKADPSRAEAAASDPFMEPLQVLLRAYAEEAGLSTFGRLSARWDTMRLLDNRARFEAEERRDASITAQDVAQPIFITGLPRSGTTFLHTLLAEDPSALIPRCWQTIYPYPRASDPADQGARRRADVERQLRLFGRLAPEVTKVHPLSADVPQECSEITAHSFRSLRFDTTHNVPSYRDWLQSAGHLEAYRYHKRFLQHLQHQAPNPGRWVLKCPDHVFALDEIRAVYPDARFVFVHRDPLHILASVARLTEILRAPFTRQIDRAAIGQQVAECWLDGARRITEAAQADRQSAQVFHVHYGALVRDPMATVRALYAHFGLPADPVAMQRIEALVQRKPDGGYGQNSYQMEQYGLDPAALREQFRAYTDYFDIDIGSRGKTPRPLQASAA